MYFIMWEDTTCIARANSFFFFNNSRTNQGRRFDNYNYIELPVTLASVCFK